MTRPSGNARQRRTIKRMIQEAIAEKHLPVENTALPSVSKESRWLEKWSWIVALVALASGLGVSGYLILAPTPNAIVGFVLISISLCVMALSLWFWLRWKPLSKTLACVLFLSLAGYFSMRWVRKVTQPSFAYIVPGVVLGSSAKAMNSWDFIVTHHGPKSSESVQVEFKDKDRAQQVFQSHPALLTEAMMNSFRLELNFGDVNPGGRGQLYAKQFQWTPASLDHEHYEIAISAKDRNVAEDLEVEKVASGWTWYIRVKDRETGKQLFACKQGEFPYGDGRIPSCKSATADDG
jgi:hypothetical protein